MTIDYIGEEFLGRSLAERGNYVGIGKETYLKRILKHNEDTWASLDDL